MAGRLKKEVPENALVQKSRPLFNLWQSGFKLFDYKVFDLYLGMIDSHKPHTKIVTLTKNDFSNILDIDETLTAQELDKRLETVLTKLISIETGSKYPIRTTLFASAYVDTTTEPFSVQLEVSEQLLNLVFEIDKENGYGYFKYRLRNTLQLGSVYSYLMFNFLQAKATRTKGDIIRSTFTVDVDYLKMVLGCEDNQCYSVFKTFNDKILKACHREITSKTEFQYSYRTIKQGRYVKEIEFVIEPFSFSSGKQPELIQEKPEKDIVINMDEEKISLTKNEIKSLLNMIKAQYPEMTRKQAESKLKSLYYYCKPKAKTNLAAYMIKTLQSEHNLSEIKAEMTEDDRKCMTLNEMK